MWLSLLEACLTTLVRAVSDSSTGFGDPTSHIVWICLVLMYGDLHLLQLDMPGLDAILGRPTLS